ncbi:MAG: methyltransferase domain-containing protein [Planctomycetes bacterium]|nr:methyltransferase domain-containing protein [Planctomycetota bacterium]
MSSAVSSPPSGDFDYNANRGTHTAGYGTIRRADPRIQSQIHSALGTARTVLNIGAGAGSYEPTDRHVVAIEPAAAMRARRPAHAVPAIIASAESLPFDDLSFDAAMGTLTVHQWRDRATGLRELCRVTRHTIVLLTFDPEHVHDFWLNDYIPELTDADQIRMPRISALAEAFASHGFTTTSQPVILHADCIDGFTEAYFARPEMFLDDAVRQAQSAWGFVPPGAEERAISALRADLANGAWERKYGHHRTMPTYQSSLRVVVAQRT